MANEDEKKLDDIDEEADELGNEPEDADSTDWKAEAKKARGIATRYRNKLIKAKEKKKEPEGAAPAAEANKGFDYAQKAFLKASGIAPGEFELVQEVMAATGKSIDDVLESKYFQAELKERRDDQASKDAVPNSSKRASNPTRDTVEYWIAKGELPPADQRELRQKVVNARYDAEKNKSHFTKNPVA